MTAPRLIAVVTAPSVPERSPLAEAAFAFLASVRPGWGILLDLRTVLSALLGEAAERAGIPAVYTTFAPIWRHPDVKGAAVFGDARAAAEARKVLGPERVREWERESGIAVLQPPLESEIQRQEQRARAAGVDRVH